MTIRFVHALSLVAFSLALTACSDATGPQRSRAAVAGVYVLASVNGQSLPGSDPYAPTSGAIYLWPNGRAERHVSYHLPDARTEEDVATGTFRLENGTITLDLQSPQGVYPWTVTGKVDGGSLTLSYPGPADGTIVEQYRRL